ncbi:eIF-2-alpha kinase activator GCN1-like [Sinocyclocheilus rhinocerous]|uniref:eIF-2-alpha kinase activator GCN1-like n=1 Tax=Sinocyclocheilus rhinocerous TaxID=307959 RepID=UPI0007BA09DB|nr:PREDICTED: eIF-2-alpha kinase activator GCN1-like [Sinocyclocheilus rhinocerous]
MAADTQGQVSDTLKRFAVKVTSSSVKERKEILEELKECVKGKDLPEPAIKGLCKLFYLTLHRYRDAASRRALLSVIEVLVYSQPDAIATNLPPGLLSCGVVSKGMMPGKSTASGACCALPWTCLIVRTVFPSADKREGANWKKLVEVQSLLLAEAVGGASGNALKSISKRFNKLWTENPGLVDQYMSTLLCLDQSCVSVPLLGLCVDFCSAQRDIATINKHKATFLDLYMKTVLMSKTRPHQHILEKGGSMLRHMSHAEFKEQLLPTLQKALLRSPENSMQSESRKLPHYDSTIKVGKDQTIDPALLFQRFLIMSKTEQFSLEDVMRYELCSFPAALFEGKEIFRKANKPQLAQAVTEFSSKKSNKSVLDSIPPTEHYVLDGGSLVHRLAWKTGDSYGAIAQSYADFMHACMSRHMDYHACLLVDHVKLGIVRITIINLYGRKSVTTNERLPPTESSTKYHCQRVYFQIMVWIGKEGDMNTVDWGWKLVDNRFLPVMTSKTAAPESLLQMIHCSEGKLTVVAQKMSVLSGIRSCSHHAVSGSSSQSLSSSVAVMFIPYLQQEVHEGTLVHAVSVLSQWTSRFTVDVPSELREWFKKAFTLKTSTSPVRHAYLQALIGAFKGDALNQAVEFLPLLIQTVEKAAAQNTQHSLLSEGVAASVLLCRLSVLDSVPEAKLASFWNLILDEKKPLFTTEKFLSQASEETLCTILLLCERLFLDQPQRLNNSKSQMYHQATVMALLSRLWHVRKRAQQTVKKLLSSLGGSSLAHGLLGELRVVINKHKILPSDVVYTESSELTEIGRSYIAPRILLDALSVICSVAAQWNDPAETENLALDILIVTHHPSIVAVRSEMWPSLLSTMKLDAAEFIDKHLEMILPRLLEANADNQAVQNAVGSLSLLSPTKLLPRVMDHVAQRLSNPALRQVTRQEYAIMQTPEGELYDKSIIMSAQQESTKKGNMKRENKAYSFKEQIIELELQEEIKKKKGIKEEIQLTSKQKEMMQNQLENESAIRKRLQELVGELQCAVGLLEVALARRPPLIWMHLPGVLQVVLPLLQSPLAAPRVKQVFLHIGVSLMPKELHYLAVLVGHVTLRQLKPECDLDPAWAQEDLNTATQRTISLLHTNTALQRDGKTGSGAFVLSAPAFSFCFPLLQAVLSQSSGSSEETELMMTRALQVINTHVQLRAKFNETDTLIDENGPELLPRVSMLLLLTKVIGTSTPRLQVLASGCLTALCASAGGQEGCALAEQPEIDALLEALLSSCFCVRDAALRGLLEMELALPTDSADASGLKMLRRLWVAKFDVEEEGRALAEKLWQALCLDLVPELCSLLIEDVIHHEEAVRSAGAEALSSAVSQYREQSATVLTQLTELYHQKLYRPPPVLDTLGRVISEAPPDQWEARCGIALALNKLAEFLHESQVTPLFLFFVPDALNDRHADVRRCMLDAALSALNTHGKPNFSLLITLTLTAYDSVRQSVVILMGSLAKHLDKSDPKVKPIVAKLITALSTPSQQVQESVASCLPPLVPAIKEDAGGMVRKLLQLLLESDKYAERKGAAYGLAGLVKGLGILSLKQQEIMTTLTDAIQDKKNSRRREGALFAFEMLCNMLGKLFEPYVVHVLPHLLLCFGDGNQYVREAADDCAKAVTRNLSAHGVKLVLPSLLMALEEESWRTKAGSVELLGAMAYCAPKQLSSCLPNIVPKLTEVLTDSHVKVQKAGQQALRQIGSVIRNPEILAITPILLDALTDPSHKTQHCLQTLLDTKFVHFIDAPSLALIMPIVQRAFQDRSTDTRKMAAQIIGNMYSLTDQKSNKFTPYVGPILPCILKALADENEYVRDTALRAGQRIISMYAETAIALLLPELEQGLFDDLWRIRFSSVQLLGDLLFHISGVTGKMTTETASEDDNFGTAQSTKAIIGALGAERRNRVLSGLYMGRSDIQLVVRQASLHVWKIVVSNTPRTLREILPTLFTLLLGFLASTCPDKRTIAARTLGDLVKKLGEKILPEIIPILEEGLRSDKSDERQGVCIGLSEIMKSTSKDAVLVFSESLVPTVRKALCDPLEEVREAAAKTFEQLHTTIGHQALDDILPTLLKQLEDEETSEFALDGLKQVMAVKSRSVLPYLVPKLTAPPVNTRVLAFLSAVAGDALTRHLGVILPALLSSLKDKLGSEECLQELSNCQTVVLSVEDEVGQRIIIEDLLEATRGADAGLRQASVTILNGYFSRTRLDYSAHTRRLLSGLMRLMNDPNPEVLNQSWDTINSITKGVTCILPVLREGVLTGSPEQKEEAARALGGVIKLTSAEALRPSVVNITGPLIRILGDRFAWTVKTALLETLTLLLAKVGIALKPFLPQLQTTFLKALQDSSRAVRLRAAESLGQLVSIHTKVDPLFTEQLLAIRNAEDSGVRETMLQALRFVIQGAGAKVDPTIRKNITTTLLGMLGHDEKLDAGSQLSLIDDLHRDIRSAAAEVRGQHLPGFCLPKKFLSEEELKNVLQQHVLADVSGVDWMVRHGRSLTLAIAVKSAPDQLCSEEYSSTVLEAVLSSATADRIPIACSGIRAMGYLMRHQLRTGGPESISPRIITQFLKCLQNQSSDIRLVTERMLWWVCKEAETPALEPSLVKPVIKALLDNTKDKNTSVRAQSEHTLVSLLRLRQGEDGMQSINAILDTASNELLSECYRRSLKKISSLPDSNEEIDDTILT